MSERKEAVASRGTGVVKDFAKPDGWMYHPPTRAHLVCVCGSDPSAGLVASCLLRAEGWRGVLVRPTVRCFGWLTAAPACHPRRRMSWHARRTAACR